MLYMLFVLYQAPIQTALSLQISHISLKTRVIVYSLLIFVLQWEKLLFIGGGVQSFFILIREMQYHISLDALHSFQPYQGSELACLHQ